MTQYAYDGSEAHPETLMFAKIEDNGEIRCYNFVTKEWEIEPPTSQLAFDIAHSPDWWRTSPEEFKRIFSKAIRLRHKSIIRNNLRIKNDIMRNYLI